MAGNSLGTAYVQVVPKFKGGSLTSLGSEAGKGYGDAFLGQFKGVAGKLAGILAAVGVTKMVADLGHAAFDAAAEFEQLAGGAEKIFDELDQSAILADAGGAWETLNMSANEYLAAINDVGAMFAATMGDQAAYDTAQRGLQAISDYATGTGKDLGLLSDKFALITRSTSSYQSIADQFAGVLPATSEGFLEAAQQAGYLSDEYTSLTEVPIDEYQQALVGMLEDGTEALGLAGNTAAETAKTMSGSLLALSATWSNWLAGLMTDGADMEGLTNDLVTAIGNVAANALPALMRGVESVAQALPGLLRGALDAIPDVLRDVFGDGAADAFVVIVDAATSVGSAFSEHLAPWLDLVGQKMGELASEWGPQLAAALEVLTPAVEFLATVASEMLGRALSLVIDLVTALVAAFSLAVNGFSDSASTLRSDVTGAFDAIKSSIASTVNNIRTTVSGAFNAVKTAMVTPINAAKSAISNAISSIKGIFSGLKLSLPHFPLPHFHVSGGKAPWGIGGAGSPPSFGVDWYARGGFFDEPTVFLPGVGERGTELAWPSYEPYFSKYAQGIAEHMQGGANVTNVYLNDLKVNDDEAIRRDVVNLVNDLSRYSMAMTAAR